MTMTASPTPITIEYRDLAYVRQVPARLLNNDTPIETVATHIQGIVQSFYQATPPTIDFAALQPCSGVIAPGSMTLVLAPPGHGKSTFLQSIGGRFASATTTDAASDPNARGTLLYNGLTCDEIRRAGLAMHRLAAYVDQVDVHMPQLTVRETLQFALDNANATALVVNHESAAELEMNARERTSQVDAVLAQLGLTECADTRVGYDLVRGISGGQKRRLSLGETLLTRPRVLLLDEITTGLDAAVAHDIMHMIREWTKSTQGSCVSALLQPTPECFALFDRLILLRHGHVVYDGPTDRVQAYLESVGILVPDDQDLADFLSDFLNDPKTIYMRNLYRRARLLECRRTASLDSVVVAAAAAAAEDVDANADEDDPDASHDRSKPIAIAMATDASALHTMASMCIDEHDSGGDLAAKRNTKLASKMSNSAIELTVPSSATAETESTASAASSTTSAAVLKPRRHRRVASAMVPHVPIRARGRSDFRRLSVDLIAVATRAHIKPDSINVSRRASPEPVPMRTLQPPASTAVVAETTPAVSVVPLVTSALVEAFRSSPYYADIQCRLVELEAERPALRSTLVSSAAATNLLLPAPALAPAPVPVPAPAPATATASASVPALAPSAQPMHARSATQLFTHHLKTNMQREWFILSRSQSVQIPRLINSVFIGLVLGSLFYQLSPNEFISRLGLCSFACIHVGFANQVEMASMHDARQVVFKQLNAGLFPAVAYIISCVVTHALFALIEIISFVIPLYWMSGFDADAGRFFFFIFILFLLDILVCALFRLLIYRLRLEEFAEQLAVPLVAVFVLCGGFFIARTNIKPHMIWVYWLSPFSWSITSLAQNEFSASRYVGTNFLESWGVPTHSAYQWCAIAYLAGMFALFVLLAVRTLNSVRFPLSVGTSRNLADEKAEEEASSRIDEEVHCGRSVKIATLRKYASAYRLQDGSTALPFEPATLTWRNIRYIVKVKAAATTAATASAASPSESRSNDGFVDRTLLDGLSGFASPGTLTALMGSSGAGKTTFMDVLAGRKTAGRIEGTILLNGAAPPPALLRRLMGYVEQTDVHMPTQTVREALLFSARLRLPCDTSDDVLDSYVDEVLDVLELTSIAGRLVGDISMPSLSPGQLKRVTIGVELVANPPILFLDEPTSGLDSRAALVVMRVIKRIALTGRTVVCTIHQPSAELFYMFDRLLLLQTGGREAFFGDVGEFGSSLIEYFETAPVHDHDTSMVKPKLPPRTNPASWMLDVIGAGTGARKNSGGNVGGADVGGGNADEQERLQQRYGATDYAAVYAASPLRAANMKMLDDLCQHAGGVGGGEANRLPQVDRKYASTYQTQFYLVISRMLQFYWRNTSFTMVRCYILLALASLVGLLFVDAGTSTQTNLVSNLVSISLTLSFPGIMLCSASMSMLARQRAVFYREHASVMYCSLAYSSALVLAELIFVPLMTVFGLVPFYFLLGLDHSAEQFFKYALVLCFTVLCFLYFGQFLMATFADVATAMLGEAMLSTFMMMFSGIFIQPKMIPAGWKWVYYINPVPKGMIAVGLEQFTCPIDDPDFFDPSSRRCRLIDALLNGRPQTLRVDQFVRDYLDSGSGMYWTYVGWIVLTMMICATAASTSAMFLRRQSR